jgi:uroporphyrinogen-III synthase
VSVPTTTSIPEPLVSRWRVAVTRDEAAGGALSRALVAASFTPVACPVLVEMPPADGAALADAAAALATYDWIVCASVRSVTALAAARRAPWPAGVRTAAVGPRTAAALVAAGATPLPLTGDTDGADSLWTRLRGADQWPGRRVLLPTTPGGRRTLSDSLTAAGAFVHELEAYQMTPRPARLIAEAWHTAAPDAVVVASARVAVALVEAVGAGQLCGLAAVVAIGHTTAAALAAAAVPCAVAARADFADVVAALAAERARAVAP